MYKFARIFKLNVQGNTQEGSARREFALPLTCKFNIEKKAFATSNTADFSLYGLSQSNREDIYYDLYFKKQLVPIEFFGGYASQPPLPKLFVGNVVQAFTVREGPELVTRINALDGGFGISEGVIPPNGGVEKGWLYSPTMRKLMGYLPGIKPGQIILSEEPKPATRALAPNGSTWNVLRANLPNKETDLFVDNSVVNIISQRLPLPSFQIKKISANTGLLNVPIRSGFETICQMLFTPDLVIGQQIELESTIAPWVNGPYKVTGLHHTGTISAVESGDARTDVTLFSLRTPPKT